MDTVREPNQFYVPSCLCCLGLMVPCAANRIMTLLGSKPAPSTTWFDQDVPKGAAMLVGASYYRNKSRTSIILIFPLAHFNQLVAEVRHKNG
ncbi:hypothetical protein CDL15_Pgr015225 [Punica granatum]|uniref:Uncharacterized protein n=1 Tax=Punica granatum TaxID=22663 RepID=A0A218W0H2_PUNGR|nr:hypothetical protein CDL15_Pgr015225 [Punica granatum]